VVVEPVEVETVTGTIVTPTPVVVLVVVVVPGVEIGMIGIVPVEELLVELVVVDGLVTVPTRVPRLGGVLPGLVTGRPCEGTVPTVTIPTKPP
jgi:hypothetical protein